PVMIGALGAARSTAGEKVGDAGPVFPATSVAVAVYNSKVPSTTVRLSLKLQLPLASANVVPKDRMPSLIETSALGSAVPVKLIAGSPSSSISISGQSMASAGLLISVTIAQMTGATGGVTSILATKAAEAALVFPAVSVAVAE